MPITIKERKDFAQVFCLLEKKATALGMTVTQKTQLITAVSELLTNMLKYSGGGEVIVSDSSDGRKKITVIFEDKGPGIADIELAMTDGFSSGKTLGVGLPGAKRLSDEFNIHSVVGKGTIVTITKFV